MMQPGPPIPNPRLKVTGGALGRVLVKVAPPTRLWDKSSQKAQGVPDLGIKGSFAPTLQPPSPLEAFSRAVLVFYIQIQVTCLSTWQHLHPLLRLSLKERRCGEAKSCSKGHRYQADPTPIGFCATHKLSEFCQTLNRCQHPCSVF